MRETSLQAYDAELPRIQSQVERLRDFFRRYSTMRFTDNELQGAFRSWKPTVIWSRRAQLLKEGAIMVDGTKVNPSTGHNVTAYRWRIKT